MAKRLLLTLGLFSAFWLATSTHTLQAGCYEIIGCTNTSYFKERDLRRLGCEQLSDVRNAIYAENRYCFKTPKYISMYGNAGCRYHDPLAVPLNAYERANVRLIREVENGKGCRN